MKKLIPILALIPLVILTITPPMMFSLDCKINSTFWLWMTFASGFLAFLFLYQKVSTWLKLLVVWCFVSSFLSRAPFISFTMFWSVIVCAYYYALCLKIDDWTPVKKTIQAIFFFVILLVIMQLIGKDTLLNFKEKIPDVLHGGNTPVVGTIGNRMIFSSFTSILAPFLIFNPLNWALLILVSFISWSSGGILSIGAGLAVYSWAKFKKLRLLIVVLAILAPIVFAFNTGKFRTWQSDAGRRLVYLDTLRLSLHRPLGYGIATYKIIYPVLCDKRIKQQAPGREWNTAHNDWLQIAFEIGIPGIILFTGWIISILKRLKDPVKLAGLTIIAVNMMVHFPVRLCQSAFIILMFLAFCSKREGLWEA